MECGVELQGVDLHAAGVITETDPIGFGTMDDAAETLGVAEREMWLNSTDQDDLLGVNDVDASSMFYADFPPLPDFPCMSSSSSSSSTPSALPMKTTMACTSTTTITTTTSSNINSPSASSSSAASWAVLKSDAEEDAAAAAERINNRCNQQQGYNMHQQQHHHQHDLVMDHHHHHRHAGALSSTASMEIISQHHPHPDLSTVNVGDCMDDVMDTFGYMELLEANDFFDPASIFQSEEENQNPLVEFTQEDQKVPQQQDQHQHAMEEYTTPQQVTEEDHGVNLLCGDNNVIANNNNNKEEEFQGEGVGGSADDEMSMVFLEWLKSNKDSVSANDLRNVKLKKSTIESAARRLGGGKEAMKQLLKLILEWVQTSHLQNKRRKENHNNSNTLSNLLPQPQFQDQNGANVIQPISSFGPDQSNTCTFNQTVPWPPSFGADQSTPLLVAPFSQPMVGYVSDPYNTSNNMNATHNHNNPYQQPAAAEYQMLEPAHSWAPSQFTVASHYNQSFGEHNNNLLQPVPAFGSGGYAGNQYPYHQFFHGPGGGGGGDRLMRLGPSATKEARKKRMARQRRFVSHHHRHHNNDHQNIQGSDPHASARLGDNCTTTIVAAAPPPHAANPANWMYWQTMAGGAASLAPVVPAEPPRQPTTVNRQAMQTAHQGRVAPDRRQGWKPEKNLRFLLQKVLKQSDVGSLGRIVLPKKEAETHLPELEARDGISITMEDIGTSRVWNMRYRYWPNNKSRMYLLENTGDFVKANGLQEGDFIVIYSDVKCGKFMIRGVKVRQQGAKPEAKKAGKSQKNQHGNNAATTAVASMANNGTPSSPKTKTEKLGVN